MPYSVFFKDDMLYILESTQEYTVSVQTQPSVPRPPWQPKGYAIALHSVGHTTTERMNPVSNDQTLPLELVDDLSKNKSLRDICSLRWESRTKLAGDLSRGLSACRAFLTKLAFSGWSVVLPSGRIVEIVLLEF